MQLTNKKHSNKGVGLYSVLLVLLCCCIALFALAGPALSATISGTVSLPSGTASENINLYVQACDSSWNCTDQSITIAADNSNETYSLDIGDDVNESWNVNYSYSGPDYLQRGYYSTSGTTWNQDDATQLSGGQDHSNINLTLLQGNQISGTISLPNGQTAPNGGVNISINTNNTDGGGYGSTSITISEGSDSAPYTLRVPDITNASWRVSYGYWGSDYLQRGYYSTSGTTWNQDDATTLSGGQDHSNIDLTLLQGNQISGTVSLPSGTAADDISLSISICFYNTTYNYWDCNAPGSITISSGSNSEDYAVRVPDDSGKSWKVGYSYWGPDYLHHGYYSSSGTTWNQDDATQLSGGQNHSNINLTLLQGNQISGTISLPNGQTAPNGGINISINTNNTNGGGYGSTSVTISEGSDSAPYTLRVPDITNASWRVSYGYGGSDYLQQGYYSTSGTTWNQDDATALSGGQDHTNINLTLLQGNQISGTVSLPSGTAAADISLSISICFYNTTYNYWDCHSVSSDNITISSGSNSEDYAVRVPDDSGKSWKVGYSYWGSDYLQQGYYSTSGTTWNQDDATALSGGQDHSNINLTLLQGNQISGTVSLPNGQTAPSGGINISINTDNTNGGGYGSTSVTISEGSDSAPYTLRIPDITNSSWRVSYGYWGSDYLQLGYYSTSGTTWNQDDATTLSGGQDHSNINLTLLQGNQISGTVSLPSGTAAGDISLSISICFYNTTYNYWDCSASDSITISSGSNSEDYTVRVPDDSGKSWKVGYSYWGSDYLHHGYYSSSGTTWNRDDATQLSGGQDHSNINLTLLQGNIISGMVSLPNGTTASGDIDGIWVNVCNDAFNCEYDYITIPSGQNSTDYAIRIPADANSSWKVDYSYYSANDYYRLGYYSTSGTTWNRDDATTLSGDQDYADINLTLIEVKTISGTLYLPAGTTASDHITAYIDIFDAASDQYAGYGYATLTTGDSSATYEAKVPDDTNNSWIVSYNLSDEEETDYWGNGFYHDPDTVLHKTEASPLVGGVDYSNIDMTVFNANNITGTISLPGGKKAVNDIVLFVRTETIASTSSIPQGYGYGYGYGGSTYTYDETSVHYKVTIPKGTSSTAYTLPISPETGVSWRVFYSCYQGCDEYGSPGYYNTSRTTDKLSNASPLSGAVDHSGINLTLLKQKKGMLSFPVRSKNGTISIISM